MLDDSKLRGLWRAMKAFLKVWIVIVATVAIVAGVSSALARSAAEEMAATPGAVMEGPTGPGVRQRMYRQFLQPRQVAEWRQDDWEIFETQVQAGVDADLGSAPLGTAIATVARSFVGTTYTPGTLEAEGPEGLVINFRELDCVTYVETVLALTRFIREDGAELLDDPEAAQAKYSDYLTDLRYRGGELDGYPSRLHYFSEWLSDNASRGLVEIQTAELGGVEDAEAIDFMSTHPDAYRQLAEADVLTAIGEMEARLNAGPARFFIPADQIAEVAELIQDGDVIAATSTVEGLDVAHTGLALWQDGELHLIHAPLVGEEVQISERTLAQRIVEISGQDGIMVARPAF